MINFFRYKRKNNIDFQKIFIEKAIEVFNPLFTKYNFEMVKSEYDKIGSKIVFIKEEKNVIITSQHEIRDGSFFEISIGEKLDNEFFFDGYHISINRLAKIVNHKCEDFYEFPFGEKASLKSLNKAKNDFLNCASFYLDEDMDLFDKVLKLKGIRV